MRVALVCPYAWDRPGGVQSHVRSLARFLGERGHEVLTVAPAIGRGPAQGATLVGRAVPIPANGSVAAIAFGPRAAARVRRVLGEFRPDVVHLHEPLIPSISLLALRGTPAPAVGTFHASSDGSTGYRIGRVVLSRAIERLAVRTAVSDAARELIARYFPGDYHLTPNGVDYERFASAEAATGLPGGRRVLFLGRVERRKGLEVLIQALARLRPADTTLVVAGSGPGESRGRRLAESLGVPTRWLGRVPDEEVPGLYAASDVYCAPGLGGESFGIVLVEAMAAGAPVICSDLAGFREVAGGAALLVPSGDPGALADALRLMLGDPAEAESRRALGRRRARAFDWGRLIPGVEALYQRAVGA